MSSAPIPEYAPVPLADQCKAVGAQLAIVHNSNEKWVARHRMSTGYAAMTLQSLQSALRTLQALEQLLGADTALSRDELLKRLQALSPNQEA